jgi:hypothetical protein
MNILGISLAVGRLTLDQLGQVRILDPQPRKISRVVSNDLLMGEKTEMKRR